MPNVKAVWPSDPAYLHAAFSVLGLSEIAGARHERKVLAMYAASGHPEIHDDETPWCAAYVGWSLVEGGLKSTNSLLAISYKNYGSPLDRHSIIPRGAIAVWTRTGGNHVNFVLADDGTWVTCLGGNQSNGQGGGVTISRRLKDEAIAFRMPIGGARPAPRADIPADDSDGGEPVPDAAPPDLLPDDVQGPTEHGLWALLKRWKGRILGTAGVGGSGAIGASMFADPWVIAVIVSGVILSIAGLIWLVIWLVGKDAARGWIRRQVNK
jgi:uncharacterized protein (TIGR02594 family)